jgi:SAM-dependent methyltransferase
MTELAYLAAVRESYDTVAEDYVEQVPLPTGMDPLSRGMLGAFAEILGVVDRGPVADLGCGPGRLTDYLAGFGVAAFGIDASPKMIELAREAYPTLRFEVGSMTALDLGDSELGGVLAWYSTHHTPPELLPVLFAEFARTLAPGGHLLLGGHVGEGEHVRPTQAYGGNPVSYESFFVPPDHIATLLREAGLMVTAKLLQEREKRGPKGETRQYVCLLAQKPEQP